MKNETLTIQDAAAFLGVSKTTLRRWEEKNVLIPLRTAGNQRRYSKEQLATFRDNGFTMPAAPVTTPTITEDVSVASAEAPIASVSPLTVAQSTSAFVASENTPNTAPIEAPVKQEEPYVSHIPSASSVQVSAPQQSTHNVVSGFKMPEGGNSKSHQAHPFGAVMFAAVVVVAAFVYAAGAVQSWGVSLNNFGNTLSSGNTTQNQANVLAASDANPTFALRINVPAVFGKKVSFLDSAEVSKTLTVGGEAVLTGGVRTNNASINAGTGQLTASNVIYSLTSGANVQITGDRQNPVISANITGGVVSSLQGQTGALSFAEGTGIGLDGLTISNTGVLSLQGQSGALAFSEGAGITLSGLTINNSDPGSAQKIFGTFDVNGTQIAAGTNTDTFTFAAGSGITLTPNTTDKKLTIAVNASSTSQWTTTGSNIYYNLGNVGIGNTSPGATLDVTGTGRFSGSVTLSALGAGIVKADGSGVLTSGAVDLASGDITGLLSVANGGSGVNASTAGNGTLLIGNGSGFTLGNLTGTANQISINNGAGSITFSTPQDIHSAATPTFGSLNLSSNTNQIILGNGNTGRVSMDVLTANRTYTFPDASGTVCLTSGNCSGGGGGGIAGAGTTNYIAKFTSSSGISDSSIYDNGRIGIGTTSPEGLLTVSGGPAGKALAVFNYTGSGQNILTASASGTTRLVLTNSGDLNIIGGGYQIGDINVLSSTALGSGVTASSLTSVGSLSSGSITSGFGNIDVGTDGISGGDITAIGSTGFISTGNGAGLSFTGSGNHDVTASSGVLRFGAVTLAGAVTGNSQSITGLNNLSAAGTVTFGGLGTGVVQSNGSGILSSAALNLAGGASYITGTLPVTNGGTGLNSFNAGDLVYASAGNTLAALPIGTEGQVLAVSGSGAPTWISSGALNYWQRASGAVAPVEITNDLLIGGVATSSAKFQIFGITGNASTSGTFTFNTAGSIQSTRNQTLTIGGNSTGNITLSPLNGSGTVTSTGDLTLSSGKAYFINGANVLSSTTLGSTVVSSSLTSVGALTGGSIGSGFGTIATANTITGTTLNGTTGINTGASAGTQRIDSSGNLVNIGTTQLNGVTYTWPGTAGTQDYVLTTNGSGGLSWSQPSSLPGVGDITAVGNATSGDAFTAAGTSGSQLYFYDADGRGQLTIANLSQARTYSLPDASGTVCLVEAGNCAGSGGGVTGTGTAGQISYFNGAGSITSEASGFAWDATNNRLGIGSDTPSGKLEVSGANLGKALFILNETGDQYILAASASGIAVANLDRSGNLAIDGALSDLNQNTLTINDNVNLTTGNEFQINGTSVLNASTLGANILSSSLTSVGALASGSIASGFGSILTTSTIQGSDITASGTTGFTASGNGAGLTFSGTGNHIISASSGTLQIGAATLTGAITGNSQNITGVNNFAAGGTITFGALGTGVVQSNGSGQLSSAALNLAGGSSYVTGTLPVGNGGTGATSVGSAGSVAYSNGTTFGFTNVGSGGDCLLSNGSSAPTWGSCAGGTTNYWQRSAGLLAPADITDDLAIGGTATSSAKFQVFGLTGNATTSGSLTFNTTGLVQTTSNQSLTFGGSTTGNIIFSPLNGAGTVLVNGNVNLANGNVYRINGTDVLSGTTLGTGVTSSSLTTVGALASGSIANGFGTIATGNTITGTAINGTTGINTGASAGTQRIDSNGNLVNIGTTEFNGVTYAWPASDGGADYVLTTNNSGGLEWKAVSGVSGAGDITAVGNATSGDAFTAAGTSGSQLYFYDADGRGQLTIANLSQARTYTLPDASGTVCLVEAGNCAGSGGGITGSGTSGQIAFFNGAGSITSESSGFTWDATNNKFGIGTDTPAGKFDVSGAATGKALAIFNETGDQNIITASASGTTVLTLDRSGNLALEGQLSDLSQNALTVNDNLNLTTGNEFQINGTTVLSGTALGSNVVSSSLTSVGALASGSIASGFGSILTTSTIQGSDITASGTTGFTASGNGAGLTFSGTGNHVISASSGTLQIGAATLTGAITGNSQNITGLNNFAAGGTITFGALGTGVVQSNGSGQLSSAALNLAGGASYVTGTLPVGNGGTGQTSFTSNGVVYGNGSNGLNVTSAPTGGQVLVGNNSGVPTFMTLSGGVTISNTGVATVVLTTSGETAVTSSNSGLEFSTSNGLSLLRGCSNDQILKWDDTNDVWTCATDSGGAGSAGTINIENNESGVGANVDTVDFSTDFTVTASPSNEANVSIADDILNFTEIADSLTLDASTSIALSNFDLTLGSSAGNGGVLVTPNAGGNAALIVNKQSGTGDIFSASSSGTTRFTIANNGNITAGGTLSGLTGLSSSGTITFSGFTSNGGLLYTNGSGQLAQLGTGTGGQCLQSNGANAPGWGDCSDGSVNWWDQANGALMPKYATTVDFLIGGTSSQSAKFAVLNVNNGTPTASVSAGINGATYMTATGSIQTTANQTLTLGGATTGNVVIDEQVTLGSAANGLNITTAGVLSDNDGNVVIDDTVDLGSAANGVRIDTAGTVSDINGNLVLDDTLDLGSATTGLNVTTDGVISDTDDAAVSINDGLTVANTVTFSTFTNNGGILYTNGSGQVAQTLAGTSNQCLMGGTTPSWGNCGTNYWQLNDGTVSPFSNTLDLLVGGTSSASARFAVLNVNSGTPTASVSAGTNGATYITAAGNIQSTANQSLTLGGSTTGNVLIDEQTVIGSSANGLQIDTSGNILDLNGNIVLNDVVDLGSATTGVNVTTAGVLSDTDGNLVLGDTVDLGSAANGVRIDTAGTVSDINGNLVLDDTLDLGSATTGVNVTTAGVLSDTDGNLVLGDTVDLGSAANGVRIDTAGTVSDINGNLVLDDTLDLGSATIGLNVTTDGVISDTDDAAVSINDGLTVANTVTFSTFTNNGGILYTNGSGQVAQTLAGTSNQCLLGGTTPSWGACGTNYWQMNNGTVSPFSNTLDLLVGGTATTSAKFAVIGIDGAATPIASLSATTASGGNGNGIVLNAGGSIQSLRNNTLTIGGNTTGNVLIDEQTIIGSSANGLQIDTAGAVIDLNGNIVLDDVVDLGSAATGLNITTAGVISDTDGNVVIGDTVDLGSAANGVRIDTAGAISDINANLVLDDTVDIGSATNGLRVDTAGNVIDINGNIVLNDVVDLGSATTGVNVTTAGVLSDTDGNLVLGDTVDLGSATTGVNVTTAGVITDIDGNLVLDDTVDIGSATNGLRVDTAGNVIDINGNIVLNDVVDLGSATTGLNITTAGVIADTDGDVVIGDQVALGSATTGVQVTTAGAISDIDANLVLADTLDLGSASTGINITTAGVLSDIDGNVVIGDTVDLGSAANGVRIDTAGTVSDINGNLVLDDVLDLGSATTGLNVTTDGVISDTDDAAVSINDGLTVANAVTFSTFTSNGGILYTNGTGQVAQVTAGSSTQCLLGGTTPTFGSCGADYWQANNGTVSPYVNSVDLLVGGTATTSAKFAVTGMVGSNTPVASISATTASGGNGNGLSLGGDATLQSLRNNTLTIGGNTTGNITLSPLNGSGTVTSTGDFNLASGKGYQLNGTTVLSGTTLGATITASSLDSVDQLNAGSITSGFGAIDIGTDSLTAGTITSSGTTGFVANGAGAGLNFSGTGTHIIQASTGTLQINAFTMGGAITGGGNNITGLGQLTVDNLSLDGNTFSSTTGNITIDSTGGDVIFADNDTLNIGGNASDVAYNVIGDSTGTANGTNMTSDDDLYVEGNVEIDGTLYVSATNANGNVGVTIASPSCVTTNNGIVIGSSACEFGLDTWTGSSATGVVHTSNNTMDVLIGGTATTSAKFAVTNVNGSATPIASLSATTASGGNGNGIVLNAAGSIQSLRNNTLTLGGSTTGDIILDENVFLGSGTTGLNVTTAGVLSDVNGTAVEINDNLQVTGNNILSSGGTTAITLSGANVTVAGDLTVSGGDIVGIATSSIFDSVTTTINMGSVATLLNLMDSATTKTIEIGGVTNSGTDTIRIATNNTAADTIDIGNSNASTLFTLTGGDDWSITSAGVITGTQLNIDNLRLDGNTFSATTGDITFDAAGGDVIVANNDTLNVGGYAGGSAFNVIGAAVTNNNTADGDNDLYIEDELEVDGIVTIGSSAGNGFVFDPATGPTYYGNARPTEKVVLSAEYPGAILTASGSGSINGFMTSDASPSAALSNYMNYYEWNSSQVTLQEYTVAVRVTLPADFSAWTTNGIQVYYNTELAETAAPTRNELDILIYNTDTGLTAQQQATPVAMRRDLDSATAKTWTSVTIPDTALDAGNGQDLDAAGETGIIYLKMSSRDNNHVQIGDIVLNYRARF